MQLLSFGSKMSLICLTFIPQAPFFLLQALDTCYSPPESLPHTFCLLILYHSNSRWRSTSSGRTSPPSDLVKISPHLSFSFMILNTHFIVQVDSHSLFFSLPTLTHLHVSGPWLKAWNKVTVQWLLAEWVEEMPCFFSLKLIKTLCRKKRYYYFYYYYFHFTKRNLKLAKIRCLAYARPIYPDNKVYTINHDGSPFPNIARFSMGIVRNWIIFLLRQRYGD